MGIRTKIEEKAIEFQDKSAALARSKYIEWLMKEEDCDYKMAMAIIEGRTEPREPEYILGYRMSDPVIMTALFKQPGKKNRIKAAHNFAKELDDDLQSIFWTTVFNEETGKAFKKQYKKEKRKKGIENDVLES